MKRNKFVKIMAIVLVILMVLGLVSAALVSVLSTKARAEDTTIDELKEQKDDLKQKQKELEQKKKDNAAKKAALAQTLNELNSKISSAVAKKEALDQSIELTRQDIEYVNEEISILEAKIEIKNQEYDKAVAEEERQLDLFKKRLRAMEENGTISYYEILFDAKSFSDLLSRLDSVNEILQSDEYVVNEIRQARQAVAIAHQELYDAKEEQKAAKADLEAKEADLLTQVEQANAVIKQLMNDYDTYNSTYQQSKELGEQIQKDMAELERLQKELDEEIARKMREQNSVNAGVFANGDFLWPSPSCNIVTSKYGMRVHPIYGKYAMQNGVDIGAADGTKILASEGGIVMISKYSASYGNYVMINHGGDRYTLYAHMSQRLVKEDDTVSQGDVIGLVGSTGDSTGAHIHFEVYIDGKRTDPLQFFSNYVIYD
jgi:murein DD-endopeptidase MepM/ murein hydrolase activator NlpD